MVAGKVKMAMGLQKSPSSNNKNNSKPPDKSPASAKPSSPSPGSTGKQKTTMFNRSFGVYFPRASAQVQPQPQPSLPDVGDLLKLVEDLRERESRLKVELVEQKLLSRSAAVVPFLEGQITSKNAEIERLSNKVIELEIENEKLALERELIEERFDSEMSERDAKIAKMEAEMRERDAKIAKIEAKMREREAKIAKMEAEIEEGKQLSSSQRFQFNKSNLAKSLSFRRVSKCNEGLKLGDSEWITRKDEVQVEVETTRHSRSKSSDDIPGTSDSDSFSAIVVKSKGPRVPKPPPKRSSSDSSLSSCSSLLSDGCRSTDSISAPPSPPPPPPTVRFSPSTVKSAPPPPPPPPLKKASASTSTSAPSPPPPPPPPPPHKKASASASTSEPPPAPPVPPPAMEMKAVTAAKVKRAPEVVEFYQSLMKRDSRRDSGTGTAEVTVASAKDLVGEIENRSVYLRAIKSDVKTQGEFVRFLINEVETAAFTDIEDVVSFVKWLDDELTYLVDERAVLKHFDWPEKKADALREAAFEYSDLKKLESEASSFKDDARQTCTSTLKKMQTLLEKLEHGVFNLSRLRESATIRFKSFHIPIDWMLDAGFASQFKLASVKLAMKYMKRVSAELEAMGGGPDEEELIVQGVRFAFRVHQFAGGFDVETMRAFEELRDKARSCHIKSQNQQQ